VTESSLPPNITMRNVNYIKYSKRHQRVGNMDCQVRGRGDAKVSKKCTKKKSKAKKTSTTKEEKKKVIF